MKKYTEDLINKSRHGDYNTLTFLEVFPRCSGTQIIINKVGAISVNGVDIYDLDAEDIVNDGAILRFKEYVPNFDECRVTTWKFSPESNELYEKYEKDGHREYDTLHFLETDLVYFIGDFGVASEEKPIESAINAVGEYYKNKR